MAEAVLQEAKNNKKGQMPLQGQPKQNQPNTVFYVCDMFHDTLRHFNGNRQVLQALKEFLQTKARDAMQPFGSKDRPFMRGDLDGWLHAGLTFDVSVIYKISGRSPHSVYIYAVMSHDQLGTGNPSRPTRQTAAAKQMKNQQFAAMATSETNS